MNKLAKASIAGAAGFALLLGGAGTLASWNTSTIVNAGTITAGGMSISQPATAGDGWISNGAAININNFAVSPGDTLTYTKTLRVKATGNNLHAKLAIDPSVLPAQGAATADVALTALVQTALSNPLQAINVTHGPGFTWDQSDNTFTISAGQSGFSQTITLTVTFTIPNSSTPGAENLAMGGHVNLNGFKVTLTQI